MHRRNQSDDVTFEIWLAEVVISVGAANLSRSVRGIFTDKVRQAVLPISSVAVIDRRLPIVRAIGNKSLIDARIRLIVDAGIVLRIGSGRCLLDRRASDDLHTRIAQIAGLTPVLVLRPRRNCRAANRNHGSAAVQVVP